MELTKSCSEREVYSDIILPQETRKTLNSQHSFTPKTTGKRRTKRKERKKENRNLVEGKKS